MNRAVVLLVLATATLQFPRLAAAQADSSGTASHSNLGLAAVGAITAHAGWATIERDFKALAVGATVDFGHLASRRLRVVSDVSYLLTLPHEERVESDGRTYRDVFRDLSGHIALASFLTAPTARFAPYLSAGVGVHVLSSSFGSLVIDTRYNTNNFGLLGAAGARLRLGESGRRALQLEVRGVQARDVRRVSVHLGVTALFNDLAQR